MITMVEAQVKTPNQVKWNPVQHNPDGPIGTVFLDIGGATTIERIEKAVTQSANLVQLRLGLPLRPHLTLFVGYERFTNTTKIGNFDIETIKISTNTFNANVRVYFSGKRK